LQLQLQPESGVRLAGERLDWDGRISIRAGRPIGSDFAAPIAFCAPSGRASALPPALLRRPLEPGAADAGLAGGRAASISMASASR